MGYPETFNGFLVQHSKTWTEFEQQDFQPRTTNDYTIDVEVECCGVCASDVHTINGGWGEKLFPLCVGHEIIGRAVAVGDKVTSVKVGDRVGVGAQTYACLECRQCKNDNETYCTKQKDTYAHILPDGVKSQGGFSSHVRTIEHFVFPIPDAFDSAEVAPMLCAGITTYSPLVRNGAGPGKKVGILGVGGLGHFGIQFAKALGAETWAISRNHSKEEDAKKLGADGFIAIEDKHWDDDHLMTFDILVCTANSNENFDLGRFLKLLDVHGKFVFVGLSEGDGQKISAWDLLGNGVFMGASHLGSRRETLEMLDLAAKKGVKGWVEKIPISPEGLKQAVTRLHKNDVHYRFVMTDYDKAFPKKN